MLWHSLKVPPLFVILTEFKCQKDFNALKFLGSVKKIFMGNGPVEFQWFSLELGTVEQTKAALISSFNLSFSKGTNVVNQNMLN